MSAAEFELSVTCHIAAPREIAWKVWTDLKDQWFCPKPWRAEVIEEDLRPGGRSAVRMFGPNGEDTGPMEGIVLEVVPQTSGNVEITIEYDGDGHLFSLSHLDRVDLIRALLHDVS